MCSPACGNSISSSSPSSKWDPCQGKQGRMEAAAQQGEAAWLGLPSA